MDRENTYISLSTGLDPHKGIDERVASVGGWADTEASADEIAPISLLDLSSWLNTIAAGIHDEVSWEAGCGEERSQCVDVFLLVAVGVGGGVRWARWKTPAVVVGNVESETSELRRRACSGEDLSVHGGGWANVGYLRSQLGPCRIFIVEFLECDQKTSSS